MLLAKLAFDNNASDECVVPDAWLAIVNAYQSSSFFGINPGIKKIPMTAIFLVRQIPSNPMQSSSFIFNEQNKNVIFSGSLSQPISIDDTKYWFF